MRRYYDINPPHFKDTYHEGTVWLPEMRGKGADLLDVSSRPEMKYHKAVERLAWFFKREFRYDFCQYDAASDRYLRQDRCRAFLFLQCWDESACAVGACCFRWRKWSDHPHGWALQWIWFHPYVRDQGMLRAAWPYFEKEFGDFFVEPPFSRAMQGFLRKHTNFYEKWEQRKAAKAAMQEMTEE